MKYKSSDLANKIATKYRIGDMGGAAFNFRKLSATELSAAEKVIGSAACSAIKTFIRKQDQRKTSSLAAEQLVRKSHLAAKKERLGRIDSFVGQLKECRYSYGDVAKLAAASEYAYQEIEKCLTKEESLRCRELRSTALWGVRVKAILGITQAELKRWDVDGRLPHGMIKSSVIGGANVTSKKWFQENVSEAVEFVGYWREADGRGKKKQQII